jgi:hypothetical protein
MVRYDMWLMKVRLCGCALYHNEGLELLVGLTTLRYSSGRLALLLNSFFKDVSNNMYHSGLARDSNVSSTVNVIGIALWMKRKRVVL